MNKILSVRFIPRKAGKPYGIRYGLPGFLWVILLSQFAGFVPMGLAQDPTLSGPQDKQEPKKSRPSPKRPAEEQEPEIRGRAHISVEVSMVNVNVTVRDKKGNLITGLPQSSFTVYEDGVRQEIKGFSAIEAPITVILLIEFSRQVEWFVRDIWEAAYGFIGTLRKDDWCAIIGYDLRPTIITDFTQNKQELMDGMRRFNFPAFSDSNLSDALYDTLDRVQENENRVAVLLLSTGLDTFSRITYQKVMDKAKSSNASIYTISLGQTFRILADARGWLSDTTRLELLQSDNRLKTFAKLSGGISFEPRFITEYPSIFRTISAFLRNQFNITYASSNTAKDGKFRKIKVEVMADVDRDGKPDKLDLTYREGYIAPKE